MATNFPTSLDSLTNPTSTDTLASPSHSGQHADANDAIEALEAKVGVDGSAVTTSLDYRVGKLTGGTTGQVLKKKSNTNYDVEWTTDISGRYYVADTAPSSPTAGDVWFESDTGRTYVYYDSFWVEFGANAGPEGGSVTLTTKGDLLTRSSTALTSVAVGSNNQVLTADSAQTAGVKWATPVTVATDTLWDAKGDLAVGSGADTAARLAVGTTNNHVLTVDSSATYGIKWANSGPWTSYTPTWTAATTNPSLGNGTSYGYHCRIGDVVHLRFGAKFGSTTTFGSGFWRWSLPITGSVETNYVLIGHVWNYDSSANQTYTGVLFFDVSDGTKCYSQAHGSGDTGPTVPFTWASGDWFEIIATYRAA